MPEWLIRFLPDWAVAASTWLLQPLVLTLLIGSSGLLFVLGMIGLPLALMRMPADFFSRPERRRIKLNERRRPFWFVVLRSLKNGLGGVLLILGLVMLVVPGQGLLTIFAALFLLDIPGKRRLQRWMISRQPVQHAVDSIRRRVGRPPLELTPVPLSAPVDNRGR